MPPGKPAYTLRRIWLTKEEEEGYYYGFANRALWPLCHIAYTRPRVRRSGDWEQYSRVNARFADAVLEEIGDAPAIVLRAGLPLRAAAAADQERAGPTPIVSHFWHIPWPHREAFRICPWQEEILDGLLGSDLLGFHVQLHCNNFLETVDRLLESRVDYEHFSVTRARPRDQGAARSRSASTWKASRATGWRAATCAAFRQQPGHRRGLR